MAALIKIGAISAASACVLFAGTPVLYELAGTSSSLVKDSYQYFAIASPGLFLQIMNFLFQQTLVKMGKKNRMMHAAGINLLINNLPLALLVILPQARHLVSSVSPLMISPSLLLLGNVCLSAYYLKYFYSKQALPGLSTYLNPLRALS